MWRISKSLKRDRNRKSQQQNVCQKPGKKSNSDSLGSSSDGPAMLTPVRTILTPPNRSTMPGKVIAVGACIVSGESNGITSIDHMNLPAMPPNKVTSLHILVHSRDWDMLRKCLFSTSPSKKDKTTKSLICTKNKCLSLDINLNSFEESSCEADPPHIVAMYPNLRPIKSLHCITRDDHGRTPLHLILLRFTHGTLRQNNLCLRRAPSDVVLGLIEHEPLACSIPDGDGTLPLHYAVREGHSVKVVKKIMHLYQGAVSECDPVGGKDTVEHAMEYVLGSLRSNLETTAIGDDFEAALQKGGVEEQRKINEKRWEVVQLLLQAKETSSLPSSLSLPVLNGCSTPTKPKTPLILQALAHSAPEPVIRLLLPLSEQIFASRHGPTLACTTLYIAIARKYSLGLFRELTNICPSCARVVRDETGMGLVSASYIAWSYRLQEDGRWKRLQSNFDALDSVIKEKSLGAAQNAEFALWWQQMVYLIRFCRRDLNVIDGNKHRRWKSLEYPLVVPMPNTPRLPCTQEHPSLLHAAVSNSDTPTIIVKTLLALYPSSCEQYLKLGRNLLLPLHIACMTSECIPRRYELQPFDTTTRDTNVIDMLLGAYPRGVKLTTAEGKLALHLAIWDGRKTWSEGVKALVTAERRALRIKDAQGFFPYQMAAILRKNSAENQIKFLYMARNNYSREQWRDMTARERSESVTAVQKMQELAQLETVFELIKADPSLIEDGIESKVEHSKIQDYLTVSTPMLDPDDGTVIEEEFEISILHDGFEIDLAETEKQPGRISRLFRTSEKRDRLEGNGDSDELVSNRGEAKESFFECKINGEDNEETEPNQSFLEKKKITSNAPIPASTKDGGVDQLWDPFRRVSNSSLSAPSSSGCSKALQNDNMSTLGSSLVCLSRLDHSSKALGGSHENANNQRISTIGKTTTVAISIFDNWADMYNTGVEENKTVYSDRY